MNDYLVIESDPLGIDYEWEFYEGIKSGLSNSKIEKATNEQDAFEGTDFFLDGIRVDVTFNFSQKDHMETRFVRYAEGLKFGVRTGNNKSDFNEIVVVVGEDAEPSNVRNWILPNLKKTIASKAEIIANVINDVFCEYLDAIA